jgi:hypothetical protein
LEIMNVDDVRMIQACSKMGFSLKSASEFIVFGQETVHDLDGNESLKLEMARLIDLSHPTFTDQFQDLVTVTQRSTNELRHSAAFQPMR